MATWKYSDWLEIEIVKWEKFNPRKDRKEHSWFRLSNSIATEPKFHDLSAAQRFIAVCLFAEVSKSDAESVDGVKGARIRISWLADQLKVTRADVESTIESLIASGILRLPTPPATDRLPSVTSGNRPDTDREPVDTNGNQPVSTGITTYERTNERNETNEQKKDTHTNAHAHAGQGDSPPLEHGPSPGPEPAPVDNSPPERDNSASRRSPEPHVLTPEAIDRCCEIWIGTLRKFKTGRVNLLEREKLLIVQAMSRFGPIAVELALEGARYEPKDERFDPSKFVMLHRYLAEPGIERFINLGAQERHRRANGGAA